MNPRRQTGGTDIQTQAAQWLTELEDAGARQRAACLAWLKASPEHTREFLLVSAIWEGLNGVDAARRMDVDGLLQEATAKVVSLGQGEGALAEESNGRKWWWGAGIAAGMAVAALGAWWAVSLDDARTYATAVGEQRTVKLPDGSMVELNTQSRIAVNFDAASRSIRLLEGEALFTVAREAARPFRVGSEGAMIEALGTRFNVYRMAQATTVSVIEGAVRVSVRREGGEGTKVLAGEQVRVAVDGALARAATPDVDKAVAWRNRQLIFRGDTLETVAAQVNRYNNAVRIAIEGEARRRRMIGVFAADDPESLVQFLEKEGDLSVERRGAQILIRERGD
jgi:transmembrane sensor